MLLCEQQRYQVAEWNDMRRADLTHGSTGTSCVPMPPVLVSRRFRQAGDASAGLQR
jgi:hypothetical protein